MSLQRGLPRSNLVASHVSLLSSMQVNRSPPILPTSLATKKTQPEKRASSKQRERESRTVVDTGGNATTGLAIDVAHILLQARGGDAASSVGNGAVGILAAEDRGAGGDGSSVDDGEEREDGGECELHFGW